MPGNRITSTTMISMMTTQGIDPQQDVGLMIDGGATERR